MGEGWTLQSKLLLYSDKMGHVDSDIRTWTKEVQELEKTREKFADPELVNRLKNKQDRLSEVASEIQEIQRHKLEMESKLQEIESEIEFAKDIFRTQKDKQVLCV